MNLRKRANALMREWARREVREDLAAAFRYVEAMQRGREYLERDIAETKQWEAVGTTGWQWPKR